MDLRLANILGHALIGNLGHESRFKELYSSDQDFKASVHQELDRLRAFPKKRRCDSTVRQREHLERMLSNL